MSRSPIALFLLLTCACSATGASEEPSSGFFAHPGEEVVPSSSPEDAELRADADRSASSATEVQASTAVVQEASAQVPRTSETAAKGASASRATSSSDELSLWDDPRFKRRLVESYVSATDVEPTVTVDERDQILAVLELISEEKQDEALALIEESRNDASSASFDFTEARIHFDREEYDRAAQACNAAISKFPNFRRAWSSLGLIHVRRDDMRKAARAFTRVVELGGNDAITYGPLGYAYWRLGDHLAAESAYRMAVLLDPETMDWKKGLARSLFEQQRYADAAALCESLIAEHPERVELWLLQANAFIGQDKPGRAAENYEVVERLGGSTPDSLNMLGRIYVNDGIFDLAVEKFLRAMELAEQPDFDVPLLAANSLTRRGARDEARTLIEAIEGTHGETLEDDARVELLKLKALLVVAEGGGAAEEASVLEQIIQLDPLDGQALISLGQFQGREGDLELAAHYFERAAALEDFEADANVRHAQLLVRAGRHEEALPLLRRAQMIEPRQNVQTYLEQVERVARGR